MYEPAPQHPLSRAPRTWPGAQPSVTGSESRLRTPKTLALAVLAGVTAHCAAIADGTPPCGYSSMQVGNPVSCGIFFPSTPIPKSLNNLGQWVGYRFLCPPNDLFSVPLWWSEETGVTIIPTPPGVTSAAARGMNDVGTVVGTFSTATHADWACVWLPDGQFIEIPPTGGNPPTSWAADVNNSNVVVGWRKVPAGTWAFVWEAGNITMIDPTRYGWPTSRAAAISDSGFVVGQFGADSNGTGRAFRWKDGALEILQPLPGALTSNGFCVNEVGLTFGSCRFVKGSNITNHPTVWDLDGVPTQLPLLAGYQSGGVFNVNELGTVRGSVSKPSKPGLPSSQYVVWLDGQVHSMTSLLGPGHGEIQDLNDLNQFVSDKVGGPLLFSPQIMLGDLNFDCTVNGTDLILLLEQWGTVADTSADFNADGNVDATDLGILLGAWTVSR